MRSLVIGGILIWSELHQYVCDMIKLPDFSKAFDYENNFYLSCNITRVSKILAHYELYKMTKEISGELVECGVFKGNSLLRFAIFRDLFGNPFSKKIIAFDSFGKFPETKFSQDIESRKKFINDAGNQSISKQQMIKVLKHKEIYKFIELVKGNITKTIPAYLNTHPELRISLLNIDTDLYEPAVIILKYLYPRIVKGGVIILDDYGVFPGETQAVEDFFKKKNVEIRKFPFAMTPSYIIK